MIGIPFSFKNHPVPKNQARQTGRSMAGTLTVPSEPRFSYRKMASFCKLFSMMDALDAFVLIIGIIGGNLPSLIGFIQGGNMGPSFYSAAVKEDFLRGTTGNVNHKATYGYMSSWGLSRKFWWTPRGSGLTKNMELWSSFYTPFPPIQIISSRIFSTFFWVKKPTILSNKKNPRWHWQWRLPAIVVYRLW